MKKVIFAVFFFTLALGFVGYTKLKAQAKEQAIIHPDFTLRQKDLPALVSHLPQGHEEEIMEDPYAYLDLIAQLLEQDPMTVYLVDKQHSLPDHYVPEDLVNLNEYPTLLLSRNNLQLRELLMPALLAMNKAARQDNISLLISSTYRSFDYQTVVYNRIVKELGQEAADRESAKPGTSQHQLGLALDFDSITNAFASKKSGIWVAANAGKFGFALSYPDGYEDLTGYRYESWHYRFIGETGVILQQKYFADIQQNFLLYWNEHQEWFRQYNIKI